MSKSQNGVFITFEGGEGAGKSTQIGLLADKLADAGRDIVVTREPGGSAGAELIRTLLVEGDKNRWSAMAEALLMIAARRDHLDKTIIPALERGAIVISDRFADSTMAYQGIAGALGEETVTTLHKAAIGDAAPDLTLIMDIPPEAGLARAGARGGGEARFESKGLAFHKAVRAGFRSIAAAEARRCILINADQPIEMVSEEVWRAVIERLPKLFVRA